MELMDLTGQKFSRLTVIGRAPNHGRRTMWNCKCDCGKEVTVRAENLRSGNSKSCGCLKIDHHPKTANGLGKTRLAGILNSMKQRCYNPKYSQYYLYGGRGIRICDEWLNDSNNFYSWAFNHGYKEDSVQAECSIDRIDVDGNYCPENCRWVDSFAQANNTRRNIFYEFNGERHTLTEWSRIVGIKSGTLYNRINSLGWSIEDALTLPSSPISQRNSIKNQQAITK